MDWCKVDGIIKIFFVVNDLVVSYMEVDRMYMVNIKG